MAAVLTMWTFAHLGNVQVSAGERAPQASTGDSTLATARLEAKEMMKHLAGYDELLHRFTIEDAMVGYVGRLEQSLHVSLLVPNSAPLNAVWWYDPLDPNPLYDWNAFLKLFDVANSRVANHPWLMEWRQATPGRQLELHAWGLGLKADDTTLDDCVMPAWQEAGFKGKPALEVVARKDDASYVTIYFGHEESRALITAAQQKTIASHHWLDDLSFFFHRRCQKGPEFFTKYVVVESAGTWAIHNYMHCEP